MKKKMLLMLFIFTSCSFLKEQRAKIEVVSEDNPFSIRLIDGEKVQDLGQSPLKIEPDKIQINKNDPYILLSFSRPGFIEQRLLLSLKERDHHTVKVKLISTKWWSDRRSPEARDIIEHVTGQTVSVQRLMNDLEVTP